MNHAQTIIDVVVGLALQDGKVLLVQRHPSSVPAFSEAWAFAGGKVEPDETYSGALEREWIEELSCHITVGELLHTCVYRTDGYPSPFRVWTYAVAIHGAPILTPAGGQDMRWVPVDSLSKFRVLAGTVESIDAYLAITRRW